ncbi:hypothetical protein GCM10010441_11670 [Kitasatospora paracochleata]|uniref:hypothetical protein n=1 Tax=Kitasatospora paracochleata TaxID=58354 RepID=UPI0031DF265D
MSLGGAGRPDTGPEGPRTCPSAPCAPGAGLLGVVSEPGRLAYLPVTVLVDRTFAERAATARLEGHYRFTGPCAEGGCAQWTGEACGVIDRALDAPASGAECEVRPVGALERPFPDCGIRGDCRWFAQRGAAACGVCPGIAGWRPGDPEVG